MMKMTTEELALIAQPLDADNFPKAYKAWGDDGFDRINALLPKAAMLVNRKVKSKVVYAGLSESKSVAGKKPVIFVDCDDNTRYYIAERHVRNSELPKPEKTSAL